MCVVRCVMCIVREWAQGPVGLSAALHPGPTLGFAGPVYLACPGDSTNLGATPVAAVPELAARG